MFNFFHNLGIGIASAFISFTGAFYSQPASMVQSPSIQVIATTTITSSTTTSSTKATNSDVIKKVVKEQTPVSKLILSSNDTQLCNGTGWKKCPLGENFVCPSTGNAYCETPTAPSSAQIQGTINPQHQDASSVKQSQYKEMKNYKALMFKSNGEQEKALSYSQQAGDAAHQKSYALAVTYSQSAIDADDSAYQILLNASEPDDLPFSTLLTQEKKALLKMISIDKQTTQIFYEVYTYDIDGNFVLASNALNQFDSLKAQRLSVLKNEYAPSASKLSQAEEDYFQGFDLSYGLPWNTSL